MNNGAVSETGEKEVEEEKDVGEEKEQDRRDRRRRVSPCSRQSVIMSVLQR